MAAFAKNGSAVLSPSAQLAAHDSELAALRKESAQLQQLLDGGEASLDELERVLTRQAAIRMRTSAVEGKRVQAEAALEAERQAANEAEARAAIADATAALEDAAAPLLAARDLLRKSQAAASKAATLRDQPTGLLLPGQTANDLERMLRVLFPRRFDLASDGLGATQLIDKAAQAGK